MAVSERKKRHPLKSPLTRRILAVNFLAPILLVAGLLYLDNYQRALIAAELSALRTNAEVIAAAVGEGAVAVETILWDPSSDEPDDPKATAQDVHPAEIDDIGIGAGLKVIDPSIPHQTPEEQAAPDTKPKPIRVPVAAPHLVADTARVMIRRLAEPAKVRARLFNPDGNLVADSRLLVGHGGLVQVVDLPPIETSLTLQGILRIIYDRLLYGNSADSSLPAYGERATQKAADYGEVTSALAGDPAGAVRAYTQRSRLLSVAVPVQHYKRVVGALMLSRNSLTLEENLFTVRLAILELFMATSAITVLLSFYLSGTIARPLGLLATAAELIRSGQGRRATIPDFKGRHDEIGELATALHDMTDALWQRMDAIERFAADVSHEIKNPLTSIRSAIETVSRLKDPERQRRLITIIQDDVLRLDRLISDISDSSRLDSELSRAERVPVDLRRMLETLVEVYGSAEEDGGPSFALVIEREEGGFNDSLTVRGIESRLVQVFRNLIANALSFSPPDGTITLRAGRADNGVWVAVEDEGPGIPTGKEMTIFDRFYSERPSGEKFGTHSGLGLSISKQIIDAHEGTITAENRIGPDGKRLGARFVVRVARA